MSAGVCAKRYSYTRYSRGGGIVTYVSNARALLPPPSRPKIRK